jgi:hypothetical protein
MTDCNPFIRSDQLQVDRAEGSGAVLGRDGVVHRAAGYVFELLITDRFWFVGLFAHMVGCLVWFLVAVLECRARELRGWNLGPRTCCSQRLRNRLLLFQARRPKGLRFGLENLWARRCTSDHLSLAGALL